MKFGKRLQQEASQRWPEAFLDYKALKKSIAEECASGGPEVGERGSKFLSVMDSELRRVSTAYDQLEARLMRRAEAEAPALRRDALDLRKVAVLNQLAVTKALKKARRHLGPDICMGEVDAVTLLAPYPFFRSTRLASLLTHMRLDPAVQGDSTNAAGDDDFRCPICLEDVRAPVVLTCAHRFCWSCLLAYGQQLRLGPSEARLDEIAKEKGEGMNHRVSGLASNDGDTSAASTGSSLTRLSCPVCRQQHLLDLENLEIDTVFEAFLELLHGSSHERGASTNREQDDEADVSMTGGTMDLDLPPGRSMADEEERKQRPWPGPRPPAPTPPRTASLARLAIEDDTGFDPMLPPLQKSKEEEVVEKPAPSQLRVKAPREKIVLDEAPVDASERPEPLLPPLSPTKQAKLVVCLDLDGTLVTTFSPSRVPILPPGSIAYQVGEGSRLNPHGVVVVERPGLGEFLVRCARYAELVLFTAGLEDYAAPIADALEQRYGSFAYRLYRPATVPSPEYPCVKDLGRLGRPLTRTVLVDDTPLAFCFQPDNGVPVLQFRGDVDDRLLTEALLPLLETLADAHDVRAVLHARFNMRAWFAAQTKRVTPAGGRRVPAPAPMGRVPTAPGTLFPGKDKKSSAFTSKIQQLRRGQVAAAKEATTAPVPAHKNPIPSPYAPLLVLDFDQSLMHVDAQEYLCEMLSPELTSLLAVEHARASWIPTTNAVWREMARRGITREAVLKVAASLAEEMPLASRRLLRWAAEENGWRCAILSDCNSWVIGAVLRGAGLDDCVHEVITNPAVMGPEDDSDDDSMNSSALLTVRPRQHGDRAVSCEHCPPNLCKGAELDDMLERLARARQAHQGVDTHHATTKNSIRPPVIYVGDGPNDLCPALRLKKGDFVLAREGFALDTLLDEHEDQVQARVLRWNDHDHLLHLVQTLRLAVS